MIRRPPRSTRTDTLFPYTTLFRSRQGERAMTRLAIANGKLADPAREFSRLGEGDPDRILDIVDQLDGVMIHNNRSEEHTSELQSLMRISYAVFCLKKKKKTHKNNIHTTNHNTYQKQNHKLTQ